MFFLLFCHLLCWNNILCWVSHLMWMAWISRVDNPNLYTTHCTVMTKRRAHTHTHCERVVKSLASSFKWCTNSSCRCTIPFHKLHNKDFLAIRVVRVRVWCSKESGELTSTENRFSMTTIVVSLITCALWMHDDFSMELYGCYVECVLMKRKSTTTANAYFLFLILWGCESDCAEIS